MKRSISRVISLALAAALTAAMVRCRNGRLHHRRLQAV